MKYKDFIKPLRGFIKSLYFTFDNITFDFLPINQRTYNQNREKKPKIHQVPKYLFASVSNIKNLVIDINQRS